MKQYSLSAILLLLAVGSLLTSGCGGSGRGYGGGGSGSTYGISGTVTSIGSPTAGVTISISGYAPVKVASICNYTIPILPNGNYRVTPSSAPHRFTPVNKSVTINRSNVVSVNFRSP